MTLNRREFAAMLAGAVGGLSIPLLLRSDRTEGGSAAPDVAAPERGSYFDWRRIGPRVRVALLGGGNSLLVSGARSSLVVDGKNFGLGRTLAREARSFGSPITWFVNTHHHGDHTGGNEAFGDARRLAHANAAPRILETAAAGLEHAEASLSSLRSRLRDSGVPDEMSADLEDMIVELDTLSTADFGPTETFQDVAEIDVGGDPVLVRWASPGHTDGDAFLHLPGDNVLHCGDLLFHRRHPYVDVTAGATPRGWIRCLDAMLALCDRDTVVVPGHGEITDRAGLEAQRDYFQELQRLVEVARSEGRSREEVELLDTPGLRGLSGAEQQLGRNLGIVYDEMAG